MALQTNYFKATYLFYITFCALLAIFPVTTDYIIQSYQLLDMVFLTPPSPLNPWVLGSVIAIFACTMVFISIRKNNTDKLEYLSISVLRYSLAFVMVIVYGYCKIVSKQFQLRFSALEMPLQDVSDFDLTWYFYGRSNAQTLLLGLLELIPGILLLWRRTTLLGALILFPVIGNVMLLDNFNDVGPHLNVFSTIFFFFDIGILLFYRNEILQLFSSAKHKLNNGFTGRTAKAFFTAVKIIFIVLIIYRFGKGFYGAAQMRTELSKSKSKCFGIFEIKSLSYNNKTYSLDSLPNYWKKLYFEKIDSRDTRLKDKNDAFVNARYSFHDNRDSITIATYTSLDEEENPIGLVMFNGTYFLSDKDSTLTLNGVRNDTLMKAVYQKLPVNGHDWWW